MKNSTNWDKAGLPSSTSLEIAYDQSQLCIFPNLKNLFKFNVYKILVYIFVCKIIKILWKFKNYEGNQKLLKFSTSWDQAQLCGSITLEMTSM